MLFRRIGSFAFVALFVATTFVQPVFAQETHTFIGLSPSSIAESDILRDRVIEKTVNLQRDLSELPLTLEVSFTGEDARFLRGPATVDFPVGVKQVQYTFEIFPEAAATGGYSAQINFLPVKTEVTTDGGGTGFGIRRGVSLKVGFTVTDQEVIEYDILHVEVRQTEEGLPFYFTYTVDNTGNVEWRPDQVEFVFKDYNTGVEAQVIDVSQDMFEVAKPGSVSIINTNVDHELSQGTYDVSVLFFDNGEIVYSASTSLIVFAPGTLDQQAELVTLTTNKEGYVANEKIKLVGTLKNTGDLVTKGTLVTELYSLNTGELVDILTSDGRTVDPGASVDIDQVTSIAQAGTYRFVSYVEYAGSKVTEKQEALVSVEATLLSSGANVLPLILLLLAALIGLFLILFLFMKRRKRRRYSTQAIPQVTPVASAVVPPTHHPSPVSPQVTVPTESTATMTPPQSSVSVEQQTSTVPSEEHHAMQKPISVAGDVSDDDDMWTISLS